MSYSSFFSLHSFFVVKYLDNIPDDVITELNIPTGAPLVYYLDENLKPIPHPDAIAPLQVSQSDFLLLSSAIYLFYFIFVFYIYFFHFYFLCIFNITFYVPVAQVTLTISLFICLYIWKHQCLTEMVILIYCLISINPLHASQKCTL